MISREQAFESLAGPVPTIRTPYTREGDIDWKGLANLVDFILQAGATSIVLTAGDSHYMAMSDKEISEVTKAVAAQVDGRAMMVAADRYFDTKQAISFAKFAKNNKCDMLMVLPPSWANANTPETTSDHYAKVAETIPVMMVTNLFIPRGIPFALETIRLAVEKSTNILSVKDDMCGEFARRLASEFGDTLAVWAGGQKQNHLNMALYGATGYLSTFLTFKPEVAWRYWNAFNKNRIDDAVKVIEQYDLPFFELIKACNGGFDAGIHGTMELLGICERWRPKPYHSLNDEELELLKDGLNKIGVL